MPARPTETRKGQDRDHQSKRKHSNGKEAQTERLAAVRCKGMERTSSGSFRQQQSAKLERKMEYSCSRQTGAPKWNQKRSTKDQSRKGGPQPQHLRKGGQPRSTPALAEQESERGKDNDAHQSRGRSSGDGDNKRNTADHHNQGQDAAKSSDHYNRDSSRTSSKLRRDHSRGDPRGQTPSGWGKNPNRTTTRYRADKGQRKTKTKCMQ